MSLITDKNLVAVAIDAAQNKMQGNFSTADANAKIREAMIEELGTDELSYKAYRRNPVALFEFIEETITPIVHKKLEETFYQFAEFKNITYGDQNKFYVPNTELFRVSTIAEGSGNIRRKRLESTEFEVEVRSMAAGFYEEFNRFLAGRVDFAMYAQKLADSFSRDMAERISNALYGSYDSLGSTYTASVAADSEELKSDVLDIAAHVEAEHGQVVIVGTKAALSKLKPEYYSDEQAGQRNLTGMFGVVDGYELIAIPQFHKNGTDEFSVKDDHILVLPTMGEKLIKVVIEGSAIVRENTGTETHRDDFRMNYDVIQRAGVQVLTAAKYGMVKIG